MSTLTKTLYGNKPRIQYAKMPCDGCGRMMEWIEPDPDLPRYCGPCNTKAIGEYPLFWANRIAETMKQKRRRLISNFRAIGGVL